MEENRPEAWIGETVEVALQDRSMLSGKLLKVKRRRDRARGAY